MEKTQEAARLSLSRRSFLQGMTALGAAVAVSGCSNSGGETEYIIPEQVNPIVDPVDLNDYSNIRYGSSGHNCGAKCVIKAYVNAGRIVRFAADENEYIFAGTVRTDDRMNRNASQSRSCAKCRSYRLRIYHPGRLKYPLKQTKTRGDLTGFVRMSWADACDEIARKHNAIIKKYGPESIYNNYACGAYSSNLQGGGYNGSLWLSRSSGGVASKLIGGHLNYAMDYSFHQSSSTSTAITGFSGGSGSAADIAGVVKNVVLWGSNIMSTVNSSAMPWARTFEEFKERGEGKVYFIGPEFVDTGVTVADTWVRMKPYTDTALIHGMLHHLITNTINPDGSLNTTSDPKTRLDLDYIDSMVYGFFDSPEYWIKKTDGTVSLIDNGETKINEVPAGRSLSAYIMGSDDRLTKCLYKDSTNYMAQAFKADGAADRPRNKSTCSYPITVGLANTKYQTKKDFSTPKTPAWASKITGIPEDTIKQLAELYCNTDNHPIYNEWSGAQQKQSEGVITRIALHCLFILTKCWGKTGCTIGRGFGASIGSGGSAIPAPSYPTNGVSANPTSPTISCTVWHLGVKFAFADQLKAGGYTGKYIPDWDFENAINTDNSVNLYMDDGGSKSLVKWKRTGDAIDTDANGFYIPETGADGKVIRSGIRFIMNPGGNILINQHMNSNDSREMFEKLPIASTNPNDPETLCIVSIDNFLSPTPRWSDYVLPAATTWEQDDFISISKGSSTYIPVVSNPPGEAKSMLNTTVQILKAYEKVDTSKAGIAKKLNFDVDPNSPRAENSIEDQVRASFATASANSSSPYYGKTWEEYLENTYLQGVPGSTTNTTAVTKSALYTNVESYLAGDMSAPFARSASNFNVNAKPSNPFGAQYPTGVSDPNNASLRFHVYSDSFVWNYENRYAKWHGYLDSAKRGQANIDSESDKLVQPIPMYYAYEDYFNEAYGVMNGKHSALNKPLLLTTTHDRFRAHSSVSESPYVRELTHRVVHGKAYSGNDWGKYALIGTGGTTKGETFPRLNSTISSTNLAKSDFSTASWSEIWMNADDARERGIADGDLVLVKNPIGAVRCIARVTHRCVKGFLGLHQGCWYDPNPIDDVDDGGNCNTLMASRPSRFDHGNGQQSAWVEVTKVL